MLNPVTGALDEDFLHAGHCAAHVLDRAGAALARDDGIARAGDEQRGLADDRVLPRRSQFPVAIDVAIPVEPAAKTGAPVFGGKLLQVFLAQPLRQGRRNRERIEKAVALVNHHRILAIDRNVA